MAIDPQIYRTWGTGWFYGAAALSAVIVSAAALTALVVLSFRLIEAPDPTSTGFIGSPLHVLMGCFSGMSMSLAVPLVAGVLFPLTNRLIIHPAQLWIITPYFAALNVFWSIGAWGVLYVFGSSLWPSFPISGVIGIMLGGALVGMLTSAALALRSRIAQPSVHKVF